MDNFLCFPQMSPHKAGPLDAEKLKLQMSKYTKGNQLIMCSPSFSLSDRGGMKHQSTYNRLRRIEGQIRGIETMIEKDRTEQDILIQLEAVKSSVSSTIASLIEKMLTKNVDGQVILDQDQLSILLRSIKK